MIVTQEDEEGMEGGVEREGVLEGREVGRMVVGEQDGGGIYTRCTRACPWLAGTVAHTTAWHRLCGTRAAPPLAHLPLSLPSKYLRKYSTPLGFSSMASWYSQK